MTEYKRYRDVLEKMTTDPYFRTKLHHKELRALTYYLTTLDKALAELKKVEEQRDYHRAWANKYKQDLEEYEIRNLKAENTRLKEQNERLKSRGIEDMQWEITHLKQRLEQTEKDLGDMTCNAERERLDKEASQQRLEELEK